MLAKLLKRKESRQSVVESTTTTENGQQQQQPPLLQYRYQRPDLIGKVSKELFVLILMLRIGRDL